jgi:hypothetical protein
MEMKGQNHMDQPDTTTEAQERERVMATYTLQLSSAALSDHMSRLYERVHTGDDEQQSQLFTHVDGADHGSILVIKSNKSTTTARMSYEAVLELVDDMEYQAEFSYEDERAAQMMCKRVTASVRKQLARNWGIVIAR